MLTGKLSEYVELSKTIYNMRKSEIDELIIESTNMREYKDISQKHVADLLKTSTPNISDIEKRKTCSVKRLTKYVMAVRQLAEDK